MPERTDESPDREGDFDIDAELAKLSEKSKASSRTRTKGEPTGGRSPRDGVRRRLANGDIVEVLKPTSITIDSASRETLLRVAQRQGLGLSALLRLIAKAVERRDVRLLRDILFEPTRQEPRAGAPSGARDEV